MNCRRSRDSPEVGIKGVGMRKRVFISNVEESMVHLEVNSGTAASVRIPGQEIYKALREPAWWEEK